MKHAAQLISEANLMRKMLSDSGSPLDDSNVWTYQKNLQSIYSQLLTQHPVFSLENNVEKDLWNFGFRNTFNQLQSEIQTRKDASDVKNVFNWFLNSTSGFFIQLLHQICSTNSLDFNFRRKDCSYGLAGGGLSTLAGTKMNENSNENALYICQFCLIHLGDLARYRYQPKQAETFYRHAVTVGPTSGHPYNQLALLEAGKGNTLAAMFLYIRALCVSSPFQGAPSNLAQTLVKKLDSKKEIGSIQSDKNIKSTSLTRLSKEEYFSTFLHFYAILLIKGDVELAKGDLAHLSNGLSTLVATTAITKSSLVQMTVISIFAHNYFTGKVNIRIGDDLDMKKEEDQFINPDRCRQEALEVIEDLIFGMLSALMLPVYTMKEPELVVTFIALPAVLLNLEWLLMSKLMSSPALKKRQQIWPGICTLVNIIQVLLKNFESKLYEDVPLPEHWDLQGFLPLEKCLSKYSYKERIPKVSVEDFSYLRASRFTDLAKMLAEQKLDSGPVIKMITNKATGLLKFEALTNPPVEDVLDLERLTLQPHLEHKKKKEKIEKFGILKSPNSENLKEGKTISSKQKEIVIPAKKSKSCTVSSGAEKIVEPLAPTILTNEAKVGLSMQNKARLRTNVALQAILKRNSNQDSKQVTFKTNTPGVSPNPPDVNDDGHHSQLATPPPGLSLDPKYKPTADIQNTRFSSTVSQSKESHFYPLAKPNDMANQPCHPFAKNSTFPVAAPSPFPSSVPKLSTGSIGHENVRHKMQPNTVHLGPGFPPDQTRFNAKEVLGNLGMGQPWNKDLPNYTSGEKGMSTFNQFPSLRNMLPTSYKESQPQSDSAGSFPTMSLYMPNFNKSNDKLPDTSGKAPINQVQSVSNNSAWWHKDPPIRPAGIPLPNQEGPASRTTNFPSFQSIPVANINVPPPSMSQLFNRPPPPIRLPQNAEPYSARMTTFPQAAGSSQNYSEIFSRELPEQFRGSSTYSLFGPLGGVDSGHSSAQQVISPTNHRMLPQVIS